MKKILLALTFFYLGTIIAFTQSLSLSLGSQVYNNGDTYIMVDTSANHVMTSYMWITNNSNADIKVVVKKVIIDTIPGTENYFCWTSCYIPTIYVGDSLTIKAGQTNNTHLSGDYEPFGHAGRSKIMYVFYDYNNPNDSVAYICEYIAGSGVNISTAPKTMASAKVYPNPAKSYVTVDYEIPANTSTARFEIRNIIGQTVSETQLEFGVGKQKVDVSNLQNGVYFYSVIVDNQSVISKKLVIRN